MTDSILREKSKKFSETVIFLCRELKKRKTESVIVNQLLRSSTSIGANIHEAQFAHGTKDFISKFEIALKECNESKYWIEILNDTESINKEKFSALYEECIGIRNMLIASINTLKNKT